MSTGRLKCPDCDQEFTLNKNLVRHVNTVHGTVKRQDNEVRNTCVYSDTCEEPVGGCVPLWCSSHQMNMLQ